MLKLLEGFDTQCKDALNLTQKIKIDISYYKNFKNIVILGIGGSGIGADILKSVLQDIINFPIEVIKSPNLPNYINEDSLIFGVSYSGNTKETLTALDKAIKNKAKIILITSGGKMMSIGKENNLPIIQIPCGYPPRAALGYLLFPMFCCLNNILQLNITSLLEETISTISSYKEELSFKVPLEKNYAKQLAKRLFNKLPIIYGIEGVTSACAVRFKTQLNENAKTYAVYSCTPELCHNEIVAWENTPPNISKEFVVIILKPDEDLIFDNKNLFYQGLEVNKDLMKEKVSDIIEITAKGGNNKLANILSLILLGDFVSIYLSILNKVDPYFIKSIEYLKSKLS
jgi:glucose/mannose-6-phosphate isomerase